LNVTVVKFIVKKPITYTVPKRWSSYTYCKIFIDNEYKGEWYVIPYGGFKKFVEKSKKKFGFQEFKYEHWGSENRNY